MWNNSGWLNEGSSSGGGEMRIHGSDMHDNTVPIATNPNLLYNSTGILDLNGWDGANVEPFKDNFIIDDMSYLIAKGRTIDSGLISSSIPCKSGVVYTFSATVRAIHPIRISIVHQNESQLNTRQYIDKQVIYEELPGSDRIAVQFTCAEGVAGIALCIEHLADNDVDPAHYQHMKVEEGSIATGWIPNSTDPYPRIMRLDSILPPE